MHCRNRFTPIPASITSLLIDHGATSESIHLLVLLCRKRIQLEIARDPLRQIQIARDVDLHIKSDLEPGVHVRARNCLRRSWLRNSGLHLIGQPRIRKSYYQWRSLYH